MDSWHRRFPKQCAKGDEGEHATARLLDQLPPSWRVLHNVFLPGRRFNIDHVVIGPGGIIALDSKNYSGTVKSVDGTLRCDGRRMANEVAAAREHAQCLGDVLRVEVEPVICIHTAQLPADHVVADGVDVVAPRQLVRWLSSMPTALMEMQVSTIAASAQRTLDVRGLPAPPPPRDPIAAPRPRQPKPKQSAKSRRFDKLVTEVLTGAVTLAFLAWWAPHQIQSFKHLVPTTTTTAVADSASVQPTRIDSGTFSCPVRGRGWTLTVPAAQPAAAYQVQWSQAPEGPWSAPAIWQAGSPLSITGLQGSSQVFVRVGPSGAMTMQKTPSRLC